MARRNYDLRDNVHATVADVQSQSHPRPDSHRQSLLHRLSLIRAQPSALACPGAMSRAGRLNAVVAAISLLLMAGGPVIAVDPVIADDREAMADVDPAKPRIIDSQTMADARAGVAQDEPPTSRESVAYLPLVLNGFAVSDLRRPWPRVLPIGEIDPTTLELTDGRRITLGGDAGPPTIVMASHPLSSRSRSRLEMDPDKLDHFLDSSPEGIEYVFMRYAGTETEFEAFETALAARLEARDDAAAWEDRIHFVAPSVEELDAVDAPLARLMLDWGGYGAPLSVSWEDSGGPHSRTLESEGSAEWLPPITSVEIFGVAMAAYGPAMGCLDAEGAPTPPIMDLTGKVALIERGVCPFYDKVASAAHFGAIAAVIYTDTRDKIAMGCAAPSTCEVSPGIPAIMIDRDAGVELNDLLLGGTEVLAGFTPLLIGKDSLAFDHKGRPRETGSMPYSFEATDPLQSILWEAEWLAYERDLDARLEAEEDVLEIPVFEGEWANDPSWSGKRSTADIVLPDAEAMSEFDRFEVELMMSCVDHVDANCGAWDYLVHMYLCDSPDDESCGLEIGRWITAYRREGRWVSDLTPILPHLREGGPQRIQFWTVQNYALDMTFRLIKRGLPNAPREVVPLFTGGIFDATYNDKYSPIEFVVPEWVEKVEIAALITGHGFAKDTLNCGEFCNHTHHFTVNGTEYVKAHPEGASIAENFFVCANKVSEGVVPNQYGSWAYGRAGWCPGQDVPPWRVDITSSITRGVTNTITYQGLLDGEPFVPDVFAGETFDGRIDMQSYLVFYGTNREGTFDELERPADNLDYTITDAASRTPSSAGPFDVRNDDRVRIFNLSGR